ADDGAAKVPPVSAVTALAQAESYASAVTDAITTNSFALKSERRQAEPAVNSVELDTARLALPGLAKEAQKNQPQDAHFIQRFSRLETATRSVTNSLSGYKSTSPILAAFDFEQSGDQVRIVDGDGSVYSGS